VITPRRTTLFRVPDLAAFRTALTDWILRLAPDEARDTIVLVPTRAAAEQLRRTVETRAFGGETAAFVWPIAATRHELYEEIARRIGAAAAVASGFEREVIVSGAARELAEEGIAPPFHIRPALVAEMIGLYDHVRRLGRSVEDFERNLRGELEPEQETDRGARQLLQQTIFLAAVFRRYEERLAGDRRLDEHALRQSAIGHSAAHPISRVVVTVGDRIAEPDGLWPADFDLLSRLPELRAIEILATEAALGAGFLERLYGALPEIEEARGAIPSRPLPRLVVPAPAGPASQEALTFTYRDREEELLAIARRIKADRRFAFAGPLHKTAIVVRRPLPYLYLARDVFGGAQIPFETLDTLPLAAEPYAAALDVALEAVASDFTRAAIVALLTSPHFHFAAAGDRGAPADEPPISSISRAAVAACDFTLAEARYLGGLERLESLVERWAESRAPASREERRQQSALPALRALLPALRALAPLGTKRLVTEQIATLLGWLQAFDRPADTRDASDSRRLRVRAAVLGAISALGRAYARYDAGAEADLASLTAAIRRWLGAQTFAIETGEAGAQIVDARAVRYADVDDMHIVGLIDGEWPERGRRNVLYPPALLALLEPLPATADPTRRDRDALAAARAAFRDLMCSARSRIRVSSIALENDAVVEPSILADDIGGIGLAVERSEEPRLRVSFAEALAFEPRRPDVLPPDARQWAAARLTTDDRPIERFRGAAGSWRMPRISVSRLERYLDCPFRFFASEVLRLEEQPEDEDTRTPLERGRFLHELWERFFAEWQRRGHGRIDSTVLPEARSLFAALCEEALATLPRAEAALERTRLLGSALRPGIAHRVFAMEASRSAAIRERLLEFPLQGDIAFRAHDGSTRAVTLSAKVDRIDVLADGSLRVIDYKSKKTPDIKQALQLPVYSFVALESLRAERGEALSVAEALYLSFEGDKAVVPLRARDKSIDDLMSDAQDRFLSTLDRIGEGRFPPSPARRSLCGPCPYRAVCRLEIVEATAEANGD
jgi:RecB family exonuclease